MSAMCPQCGDVFEQPPSLMIPIHGSPPCMGSEQNARNPESDGRPLWSGKPNMLYYRNRPGWRPNDR